MKNEIIVPTSIWLHCKPIQLNGLGHEKSLAAKVAAVTTTVRGAHGAAFVTHRFCLFFYLKNPGTMSTLAGSCCQRGLQGKSHSCPRFVA